MGSLARPSSYAVFNCSVPPFVTTNDAMGNLSARLAAALNRGTVAANPNQPGATASGFYRVSNDEPLRAADPCIHRRRRRGYAFPYDDVHTTGCNTEDRVVDPTRTRLTIRVG